MAIHTDIMYNEDGVKITIKGDDLAIYRLAKKLDELNHDATHEANVMGMRWIFLDITSEMLYKLIGEDKNETEKIDEKG